MASVLPTMVHILESLTLSKWVAEGYVTGESWCSSRLRNLATHEDSSLSRHFPAKAHTVVMQYAT